MIIHTMMSILFSIILLFILSGCDKKDGSDPDERLNFEIEKYTLQFANFFSSIDSTDVITRKIKENLNSH